MDCGPQDPTKRGMSNTRIFPSPGLADSGTHDRQIPGGGTAVMGWGGGWVPRWQSPKGQKRMQRGAWKGRLRKPPTTSHLSDDLDSPVEQGAGGQTWEAHWGPRGLGVVPTASRKLPAGPR